jgi:uncharacterized SAM-binding protein YcdF (DUF218 family)
VHSLKSFFLPGLEPLGAIWSLMLLGAVWCAFRRQWRGLVSVAVPALLLFLFGSTRIVETVIASAEQPYAVRLPVKPGAEPWTGADAVLILGGGFYSSAHDAYGFAVTFAGTRLLAGVEIARSLEPRALVIGGCAPVPDQPSAVVSSFVQNWVQSWKVGKSLTVTNLGFCADTHDESVAFRKLSDQFGWRKVVLVTSALHMPRAEALFRKAGINVVPCACDFQGYGATRFTAYSPFPRAERLLLLSAYLHEQIGWIVYRWHGWV